MHDYEAPTFFVKGGGSAFSDRQKDIFGQLVDAEKETTERQRDNKVFYLKNDDDGPLMDVDVSRPPRRQCKKFRGKESIFKVPDVPRLKPTGIPDFKRNPHKWVRYDLGDVSQDDMSEEANRSAAMTFLHELDERKKRELDDDDEDNGEGAKPITFRNPKKSSSSMLLEKHKLNVKAEEEDAKPYFRSSKLIMPEYSVGEKRAKKRSKKRVIGVGSSDDTSKSTSSAVKLDHLADEDENE